MAVALGIRQRQFHALESRMSPEAAQHALHLFLKAAACKVPMLHCTGHVC